MSQTVINLKIEKIEEFAGRNYGACAVDTRRRTRCALHHSLAAPSLLTPPLISRSLSPLPRSLSLSLSHNHVHFIHHRQAQQRWSIWR